MELELSGVSPELAPLNWHDAMPSEHPIKCFNKVGAVPNYARREEDQKSRGKHHNASAEPETDVK